LKFCRSSISWTISSLPFFFDALPFPKPTRWDPGLRWTADFPYVEREAFGSSRNVWLLGGEKQSECEKMAHQKRVDFSMIFSINHTSIIHQLHQSTQLSSQENLHGSF